MSNNKIVELFGRTTTDTHTDWETVVAEQYCIFSNKRCYKIRKSDPTIAIGTCSVLYGHPLEPVIICPNRFIEHGQIFIDALHLLTTHEPGNELHLVSEVAIPGGSVDYFLVSVKDNKIKDFVGIELQALDTTGTVWPERQRLLQEFAISQVDIVEGSHKTYGMNWKMTAKTILMQMHHKAQTFEHLNKKLVLVIQDKFFAYMKNNFQLDHLRNSPRIGDPIHVHSYSFQKRVSGNFQLSMMSRFSTDSDGIAKCLGLQASPHVQLDILLGSLQEKISQATLFRPL